MQCIYIRGHNVDEMPHAWHEGGWPFGPGDHHPQCPRNPENYNRPGSVPMRNTGEGQPETAGVTPSTLDPATESALVRPYVAGDGSRHAAPEVDTGMFYDRGQVEQGPDDEPYNTDKRALWKVCGVFGPADYPFPTWCTREPKHLGSHHMDRSGGPGGERITWLRRGAA
jgi:hypothetical protein